MSVEYARPPGPASHSDGESFEDFRCLHLQEVRERAEAVEARPEENGCAPAPCVRAGWRSLYREMRRAGAATVAHLGRRDVERHASTLGYGYFRVRVASRDAFMPLSR
jgi:hypothetical protein